MTNLLVFFALPIATILLAIVLQKILKSPVLVAITFFAIYLIVAFAAFSDNLAEALVATIIYTILAYITAILSRFFWMLCKKLQDYSPCGCHENNNDNNAVAPISDNGNLLTISCNCQNGQSNDLLTISSNCNSGNNDNNGCGCCNNDNNNGCGCNNENNNTNNGIAVAANIVPTSNNGGRTGSIRGCYRRL